MKLKTVAVFTILFILITCGDSTNVTDGPVDARDSSADRSWYETDSWLDLSDLKDAPLVVKDAGGPTEGFIGAWYEPPLPIASCPSMTMLSSAHTVYIFALDAVRLVADDGTCALRYQVAGKAATLNPNQICSLILSDATTATLKYSSGSLALQEDGRLAANIQGTMTTVNRGTCSYLEYTTLSKD